MTAIDDVLEVHRKWLHMPDPGMVYVALGTVAANKLDGDPVWTQLVGPPGCGKTETINSLSGLPDIHHAATLTEAALLSGTPKKERDAGAKGGLLRQVGPFGLLLVKDFTSVLSMARDSRTSVLAALREVYDGSWTRHVGTGGGITLHWEGKLGLVAGCTPTIDSHHAVVGAMGERMMLYRLAAPDDDKQGRCALAHVGHQAHMRAEMAEAVTSLFASLGGWHLPPRPLAEAEETKLVDLASLAVRCRSTVERHPYTREIELIPGHEAPGRLVLGLAQLLGGMEVVGVERAEVWRVLRDVALSSMPAVRRTVLEHLVAAEAPCATPAVADALEYPETTVRRALEDLACHAVVAATRGSGKRASYYELTPWTWERWPSERCVPETPEPASYFSHLVRERISGTQDLDGGAPLEADEAMAW